MTYSLAEILAVNAALRVRERRLMTRHLWLGRMCIGRPVRRFTRD